MWLFIIWLIHSEYNSIDLLEVAMSALAVAILYVCFSEALYWLLLLSKVRTISVPDNWTAVSQATTRIPTLMRGMTHV